MFKLFLVFFVVSQYGATEISNTADGKIPKSGNINCNFWPHPSEPDEGNYGDGSCSIIYPHFRSDEKLLVRKTLTTSEGETYLHDLLNFPNNIVTTVKLLNFGRYHGATNSINIDNREGTRFVDISVDVFSGKESRMFLEVYGY